MFRFFPLVRQFRNSRRFLTTLTLIAASAAIAVPVTAEARAKALVGGTFMRTTPGTVAWTQSYVWDGIARSAIFIRPDPMPTQPAPAIVLLHYHGGSAGVMANLTRAGTLAASKGYWVILPQGVNNQWNDNPSDTTNTVDDIGFLANVIQTATAKYPIDPKRVSMAGFSGGGFMTTRFACARADLIASIVSDAASTRVPIVDTCAPSHPIPAIFVLGTADTIVSYDGHAWVMLGAQDTFTYWNGINGCDMTQTSTTDLPILVNDGTSVTLQHNAACNSGGEVNLYTVYNGGHAWPGGTTAPAGFGLMSQNLDTTTVLGKFAALWTTASTH